MKSPLPFYFSEQKKSLTLPVIYDLSMSIYKLKTILNILIIFIIITIQCEEAYGAAQRTQEVQDKRDMRPL